MLTRRSFLRLLAFLPWVLPTAAQARRSLREIRHSLNESRQRVVFEFDAKVNFKEAIIDNPPRFYVDIKNAGFSKALAYARFSQGGVISGLRRHVHQNGDLRLVLDLRRLPGKHYRIAQWPSAKGRSSRLVVDFLMKPDQKAIQEPSPPRQRSWSTGQIGRKQRVVMIDPGHGGKDPGAVGQRHTREKDVVLQISRHLYALLQADPTIKPYMTRNRDVYLRLHERTRIARSKKANLFVSVHADAARRRSARGSSVYMLSTKGASSAEAKWLANRENAADLVGGVKLSARQPVLQNVLLQMSQDSVHEYSTHASRTMIGSLNKVGKMHNQRINRAGFAVLKSPDIPSILVETGFISNTTEEKLLRSSAHQKRTAKALYRGIQEYYRQNPEYS